MDAEALNSELAGMDIYLLDQVLKGRFKPGSRILDVGCGGGRNIVWFARNGFEVFGVDTSAKSIAKVRDAGLAPAANFVQQSAAQITWPDGHFHGVICNALLHMVESCEVKDRIIAESWRVLAPGGTWFARLATDLSVERFAKPLDDGRHSLPGDWRVFLTSVDEMLQWTERLGATLLEPIKTVNVQNQRAMATWVMQKPLT